jgi:plasmid stabilization system protein ParE
MKLLFTASAQKDLIRLREFIAQKNPAAATRINQRLRKPTLAEIHPENY